MLNKIKNISCWSYRISGECNSKKIKGQKFNRIIVRSKQLDLTNQKVLAFIKK